VANVKHKLNKFQRSKSITIYKQFKQAIEKNLGFTKLSKISKIMLCEVTNLPEDFSSYNLMYFEYALISSFDANKNILPNNRQLFTFGNLSKSLIVNCIV